jgi:hypothetical protein
LPRSARIFRVGNPDGAISRFIEYSGAVHD